MQWQLLSYLIDAFWLLRKHSPQTMMVGQTCKTTNKIKIKLSKLTTWKAIKCSPLVALRYVRDREYIWLFSVHHLDIRGAVKWKTVYDRHHIARNLFQFPVWIEWTQLSHHICSFMCEWMAATATTSTNVYGYWKWHSQLFCFRYRSRAFIHRTFLVVFYSYDSKWGIRYYENTEWQQEIELYSIYGFTTYGWIIYLLHIAYVVPHENLSFSRWHFCRSVKMHPGIPVFQRKILLQLNSVYYSLPMTTPT